MMPGIVVRTLIRIIIHLLAGQLFVGIAVAGQAAGTVTVSAAISLKTAFEEVGKIFEKRNSDKKVVFNFGASGDLSRQIESGAPVDLFASAAVNDMDLLESKGILLQGTKAVFAGNTLVLIVPAAGKNISSFTDLGRLAVGKIAVGNPKTVPAGRYAIEAFRHLGLSAAVRDKLIYAENVRQVLDYVSRGEVDAGVVYATDAQLKTANVRIVETAPGSSHQFVRYPIAVLKNSRCPEESKRFIEELVSPAGRAILVKYGFAVKE